MVPHMTWRDLRQLRQAPAAELYLALLRYAQKLWQLDSTARALLALDRAAFIRIADDCPLLAQWPTPYAALQWMLEHHDGSSFLGNPRHHYQHLASRVQGHDSHRKRWTAWACWYISRQTLGDLAADCRQNIREPDATTIASGLSVHGIKGELDTWLAVTRQGPIIEPEFWPRPAVASIASR